MIQPLNQQLIEKQLADIAGKVLMAAQTAPKTRGLNNLTMCYITGEEKEKLAGCMDQISTSHDDFAFFARDAANIRAASAVILLGAYYNPVNLDCGLCGAEDCAGKLENENMPCLFNSIDLGIAIGSAVSVLKSHCIDNRVMFSAGKAAKELKFMDAHVIFAIPMNVSEKSIFFDRVTL